MTKVCKVCEKPNPNPLIKTCSYKCSDIFAGRVLNRITKKRAIKQQKEWNQRKKRLKGLPHAVKLTTKVFNRYIRLRDANLPCISCGRLNPPQVGIRGVWDCGHYKTVAARPALRFDTRNANKECKGCNQRDDNHLVGMRKNIVKRYGQARLDWLDGHHEPKHYTIEHLERMRRVLNRRMKRYAQSD